MMHFDPIIETDRAAKFAAIFAACPSQNLIANLEAHVSFMTFAGTDYPVTLSDTTPRQNCYLCSPSTAYIDYAIDETRHFMKQPFLLKTVSGLIKGCAPVIRSSGLDHQIQFNNWLLSTNPMPSISRLDLLRDQLVQKYPDRAIVIRSLNETADPDTIAALRRHGFRMLPSRVVYIAAALDRDGPSNNMKHDRRLLRQTSYRVVRNADFQTEDYAAAKRLYGQLYLEKYTPLNPQYTARYIAEMHRCGLMELMGLRDPNGDLVAVTGLFTNANMLTQPIVGYDTSRAQSDGLYRMLMSLSQSYAIDQGLLFNMSAGAAGFKRLRRAHPAVEYSAVYVDHLPRRQRLAVRLIESILTRIGVPLLKRYAL